MKPWSIRRWFTKRVLTTTTRRKIAAHIPLGIESLESRDLLSASALPVLLVVADQQDFYYREYGDTRLGIESQGVSVVVGATTTNPTTPHWGTGQPEGELGTIIPDIALADVNPNDYSAIAFVGGWGASMYQYAYNDPNGDGVTDNYYVNPLYNADSDLNDGLIAPQKVVVNNLINDFLDADKPVAGVCHGVTVLAWARVDGASPLQGKSVAVPHQEGTPDQFYNGAWRNGGYFHGQSDQVIDNGGIPTAFSGAYGKLGTTTDDVIVDGRIITGENPDSALLFGVRIAEQVNASLPPENHAPTASDAIWVLAENSAAGTEVGAVAAADGDAGQTLTYAIVGGNTNGAFAIDATTGTLTVANAAALNFEATPVFDLTIQITDDGLEPLHATANITVQLTNVVEPPVSVRGPNVFVTGTASADTMYLWSGATANEVYVWMNGTSHGPFILPDGGRVVVRGGDGNDQIFGSDLRIGMTAFGEAGHDLIVGGIANDGLNGGEGVDRLWSGLGDDLIRGGDGDDYLHGREGNDILLGGDGNDYLEGYDGRDILFGGLGVYVMCGGNGEDLLIGGTTVYDDDEDSLRAIHGIWVASESLDDRMASLSHPSDVGILSSIHIQHGDVGDVLGGGVLGTTVEQLLC